ncbi:MAG: YCF48-related protein [Flavipsychrobacter sp.]|nr:YCF48-related protein [Flavipsychrobacter sp.]
MKTLIVILLLLSSYASGQQLVLHNVPTNTDATFRGLSVVDNRVAWVSGTKGTVGKSLDGGQRWKFDFIKGFEKADFRSLYGFDALNAVVASTGAPAVILRTSDGGVHWNIVYKNEDTAVFFDGVDFWNINDGMIYGDPIDGRMLLLRTKDGGRTWNALPRESRPELEKGEASFAASGTGIRCVKENKLIIVTGGAESRFFISEDKGHCFNFVRAPIVKGQSTTGIFSVAYSSDTSIVVVGGDYKNETQCKDNVCVVRLHGDTYRWHTVLAPTRGYRECVEFITESKLVAAGPTGIDVTSDIGVHWQPLSDEQGYHVIRKSRKGNLVIAAGSKGKIAMLVDEK